MSRDRASVLDIVEAYRTILVFVAGQTEDTFLSDRLLQSRVPHQIIVLGEATKRLSREFRRRHDGVPWKDRAGMRDRLVRGYDAVNLGRAWRVAVVEVPVVLGAVEPLLDRLGEEA